MTAAVTVLALVVALLTLLVAGLLRSHAEILRQLRDLSDPGRLTASGGTTRGAGAVATDLSGQTLQGDPIVVSVSQNAHDTVLLFLSSGCTTCGDFWAELSRPGGIALPPDSRAVVVTRSAEHESISVLADLAPPGVTLVMTEEAWADYGVHGTPYVVNVDGGSGTVRGQGTGPSWEQVRRMLTQADGDQSQTAARRGSRDGERAHRVDRELLRAGLLPGDEQLYPGPHAAHAKGAAKDA